MAPLVFLNLSNGLGWNGPYHGLVRIQSTWCEQKRWEAIFNEVDYSLLIPAVAGRPVVVIDGSAHKLVPRALFQGLPWIRYVIDRGVLGVHHVPKVKGLPALYFVEAFDQLSGRAHARLKFLKRFVQKGLRRVPIYGISIPAYRDGDLAFLRERLNRILQHGPDYLDVTRQSRKSSHGSSTVLSLG